MTDFSAMYTPINCEFHDLLESLATRRRIAKIRFRDGEGTSQLCTAAIIDLYARNGAEYVSLSTGETLRLDQLLEVDGEVLEKY